MIIPIRIGGLDMYFETLTQLITFVEGIDINPLEQLMLLVGDESSESVPEVTNYLNSKNITFFGGVYPSLLVGSKSRRTGFILQKHQPVYCSLVFPYLMGIEVEPQEYKDCTAIVLVDGLSSQMNELIETINQKVGNNLTYIGGGAGFYDLTHRKCIFDNKGMYENALYVCIIKAPTCFAVEHGWKKLEGPFIATKTVGNTLCQLDNYNAFDVYKSAIEDIERITLYKSDFFMFAKDHPFGIRESNGSIIVRDPISVNEDGGIKCVATIPEGSEIYILKGDTDTLLASSERIAEDCSEKAPDKYTPILFDCISRAMFLEEHFENELSNIQNKLKYRVEGTLSIGEIATLQNGKIVIHNKSTILALMKGI
jgi:hypothetical protein